MPFFPLAKIFLLIISSFFFIPTSLLADEKLPHYERTSGVSGSISSVGSDTLANLLALWAEQFKRFYPNVTVQIQAAGSSTAPPALTESTASLGPMSRKMKIKEIQSFKKKHGYSPTAVRVAIDALALYVHKDNPLTGLSFPEIDAIFSANRRCGHSSDIVTWGQLLPNEEKWKNRSLQLYGRNSVSGTYGYFKKTALCKGDFKNSVNEQPGSASVVQSVGASINGIGYSGIGYQTANVRILPISKKINGDYVHATFEKVKSGTYPLSRYLYIYVNKKPGEQLAPIEAEFLKMVLSDVGQTVVAKDGYIPISSQTAQEEIKKLSL